MIPSPIKSQNFVIPSHQLQGTQNSGGCGRYGNLSTNNMTMSRNIQNFPQRPPHHQHQHLQQPPLHHHQQNQNHHNQHSQHSHSHTQMNQHQLQPHQNHHQQHHHHTNNNGSSQVPLPPPPPPHHHSNNYAMLGCFSQNLNGWTGIPLISTAVSTNRRPRKNQHHLSSSSSTSSSSSSSTTASISSTSSTSLTSPAVSSSTSHKSNNNNGVNSLRQSMLIQSPLSPSSTSSPLQSAQQSTLSVNSSLEYDEATTLSRLAMHAHGAPLVLTGRYRNRMQSQHKFPSMVNTPFSSNPSHKRHNIMMNANPMSTINNYNNNNNNKSSAPSQKIMENNQNICNKSTSEMLKEDTRNTAPHDTCLPRIIKPRKRRKKDRKPPNGVFVVSIGGGSGENSLMPLMKSSENKMPLDNNQNNHFSENMYYGGVPGNHQINFHKMNVQPPPLNNERFQHQIEKSIIEPERESSPTSACYCRLCDPSGRIWAFPLRRSFSDNSADIELQKNNRNVGVIGSNRSCTSTTNRVCNNGNGIERRRSSPMSSSRNGSFSDSSDSGCGDILTGINFIDDLFNYNNNNTDKLLNSKIINRRTNSSSDSGCSSNGSAFNMNLSYCGGDELKTFEVLDFPTAESLLTESINEISKKLIETCDVRSCSVSDSSSVFSDSGIGSANKFLSDELVFNFENLAMNQSDVNCSMINSDEQSGGGGGGGVTQVSNENLFNTTNGLFSSEKLFELQSDHQLFNGDTFLPFNDKCNGNNIDDENFLNNCFDMVWNTSNLLPPFGLQNFNDAASLSSLQSSAIGTTSTTSTAATPAPTLRVNGIVANTIAAVM